MALLALLALTAAAQTGTSPQINITIPEMECQSCAKKVSDKVYAVPGVGTVQANYQVRVRIVTPRPRMAVSPRQLWEAVEAAGKKPTRLESPAGTFTSKPQSRPPPPSGGPQPQRLSLPPRLSLFSFILDQPRGQAIRLRTTKMY